jgi:hypothetical protein
MTNTPGENGNKHNRTEKQYRPLSSLWAELAGISISFNPTGGHPPEVLASPCQID